MFFHFSFIIQQAPYFYISCFSFWNKQWKQHMFQGQCSLETFLRWLWLIIQATCYWSLHIYDLNCTLYFCGLRKYGIISEVILPILCYIIIKNSNIEHLKYINFTGAHKMQVTHENSNNCKCVKTITKEKHFVNLFNYCNITSSYMF